MSTPSTVTTLTIIPSEQSIIADGTSKIGTSDMWAAIPSSVHALQFKNNQAEVELINSNGSAAGNVISSLEDISWYSSVEWSDVPTPSAQSFALTGAQELEKIIVSVRELIVMCLSTNISSSSTFQAQLKAIKVAALAVANDNYTQQISDLDTARTAVIAQIDSEIC